MRTTIAGTRVVVKADKAGACIQEEHSRESEFTYKEGNLGVLQFDWEWDKAYDAVAEISVIWDHDPKKDARMVLLDDLEVAGVERDHKRVLIMDV